MEDERDLLGPAEKLIAKQLREQFQEIAEGMANSMIMVKVLADTDWGKFLLDADRKEQTVQLLPAMQKFAQEAAFNVAAYVILVNVYDLEEECQEEVQRIMDL